MVTARRSMNVGGDNPEYIVRDFTHGVHNFAAREAINEEELWWCENVIPLAGGNLGNVPATGTAISTSTSESGFTPGYAMGFNISGTPYVFAAFVGAGQSGNGYIVNLNSGVVTKILNAQLSITGFTYATQYGNLGILIIDPNGYWDYNVTTPATLTSWNNTLLPATITFKTSFVGGTSLTNTGLTGGTGGSYQVNYTVISMSPNAAGTGYVVGDTLTLTDGSPGNPVTGQTQGTLWQTQIVVTTVSAGGITGFNIINAGNYGGPLTGGSLATGPSGNAVSGGTGTGATFHVVVQAASVRVVSPGNGYATGTLSQDKNGATVETSITSVSSGIVGGQSIATYAGRVWISSGRTIYFTEVGSYNNFGGSGSFFTITDAYLYNQITVLFSANNYLYIFGPTSIDALSNVTVISGVTSFSRINIIQGVGTTSPASVFGYFRGLCFYDPSGFYILTGASPEKISEKISNIVGRNKVTQLNLVGNAVYGGVVNFRQELCACFMFSFNDNVSQLGTTRAMIAIFFRRRWWFYSTGINYTSANFAPPMVSVISPVTNLPTLYQVGLASGTQWSVYQPLGGATNAAWQIKTKFWDSHAPFHIKQAINAAIAGTFLGGGSSGITAIVDTDLGSSGSVAMPVQGIPNGYQLIVQQVNEGGGQYLGLTINGTGTDTSQINILALRGKQEGNLLE